MFGIGMPELLIILAVALIVIGPKKLPELAKSLGRAMGEFKKATNDLKESIELESETENVRNAFEGLGRPEKPEGGPAGADSTDDSDADDAPEDAPEDTIDLSETDPLENDESAFDEPTDTAESPKPASPDSGKGSASDA